jgi:signal transduction histidine kinase
MLFSTALGGGAVSIILDRHNDKVRLSVSNKGIELSDAEIKKMSKKFFRSKNAVKQRPNGAGLGLYFASAVCKAHGHKIMFYRFKEVTEVVILI